MKRPFEDEPRWKPVLYSTIPLPIVKNEDASTSEARARFVLASSMRSVCTRAAKREVHRQYNSVSSTLVGPATGVRRDVPTIQTVLLTRNPVLPQCHPSRLLDLNGSRLIHGHLILLHVNWLGECPGIRHQPGTALQPSSPVALIHLIREAAPRTWARARTATNLEMGSTDARQHRRNAHIPSSTQLQRGVRSSRRAQLSSSLSATTTSHDILSH
ncbi:hypothetical protein BC629DRAFT_1601126 [Irpex lacteus]|nr:hypothetical protein BC629DRAFT_1601126 [Irpex lacteus]